MTRAEMRDYIRRDLNKVPAIDVGVGPDGGEARVGDPSPSTPEPSNPQINQAIETAVRRLNLRLGQMIDPENVSVTVDAQTADGPYWLDLQRVSVNGRAKGDAWQVVTAKWVDSAGNRYPLTQVRMETLDREHQGWDSTEVGIPRFIVTGGMKYGLWPAPSTAGTLSAQYSVGIAPPSSDTDSIDGLSTDEVTVVLDAAVTTLAAQQPRDEVMRDRQQSARADFAQSISDLADRIVQRLGMSTSTIGFEPTRRRSR